MKLHPNRKQFLSPIRFSSSRVSSSAQTFNRSRLSFSLNNPFLRACRNLKPFLFKYRRIVRFDTSPSLKLHCCISLSEEKTPSSILSRLIPRTSRLSWRRLNFFGLPALCLFIDQLTPYQVFSLF